MEIRMYDCGFGDCFSIKEADSCLFVDFGIHNMSRIGMKAGIYRNISNEIVTGTISKSGKDVKPNFLLTHYHRDHYSGAVYMYKRLGIYRAFDEVYIPNIWTLGNSVDIVSLHLLKEIFDRYNINAHMTIYDFLISICNSRVHLVERGDDIERKYVALWPERGYVESAAAKLTGDIGLSDERMGAVRRAAKKLIKIVLLMVGEGEVSEVDIESQLVVAKREYIELADSFGDERKDRAKKVALNKFGNEISIVFQNKCRLDKNVLFTGDISEKEWDNILACGARDGVNVYDKYHIIKIPHHGTLAHYIDFKPYCNKGIYMIPNGEIRLANHEICDKYASDANATDIRVYCAECNNCKTTTRSKCINRVEIQPDVYKVI